MMYYLSDYNGNIAAERQANSAQEAEEYFYNAGYDMNKHFVISEKEEDEE